MLCSYSPSNQSSQLLIYQLKCKEATRTVDQQRSVHSHLNSTITISSQLKTDCHYLNEVLVYLMKIICIQYVKVIDDYLPRWFFIDQHYMNELLVRKLTSPIADQVMWHKSALQWKTRVSSSYYHQQTHLRLQSTFKEAREPPILIRPALLLLILNGIACL